MDDKIICDEGYGCVGNEVMATGRWLEMSKIIFHDPRGNKGVWESVSRTTRLQNSDTDSFVTVVAVLAILKRTLRSDCYILIKQFRPPFNAYTVELPAGLIGEGETPAQTALKELFEKTGYLGIVKFVGPPVAVDPVITNNTMRIVTVEIDGDNCRSTKLNQKNGLHNEDAVQVILVPVADLLEKLIEFTNQGMIIDSRLQAFSLGLVKGAPKKHFLKPAESVDEK